MAKRVSKTNNTNGKITRMSVMATPEQIAIMDSAVPEGSDRSSWIVAQALRAATGGEYGLTIDGVLLARLEAEAKRQGVTPIDIVDQLTLTLKPTGLANGGG